MVFVCNPAVVAPATLLVVFFLVTPLAPGFLSEALWMPLAGFVCVPVMVTMAELLVPLNSRCHLRVADMHLGLHVPQSVLLKQPRVR